MNVKILVSSFIIYLFLLTLDLIIEILLIINSVKMIYPVLIGPLIIIIAIIQYWVCIYIFKKELKNENYYEISIILSNMAIFILLLSFMFSLASVTRYSEVMVLALTPSICYFQSNNLCLNNGFEIKKDKINEILKLIIIILIFLDYIYLFNAYLHRIKYILLETIILIIPIFVLSIVWVNRIKKQQIIK